jgi:hypothetical protein
MYRYRVLPAAAFSDFTFISLLSPRLLNGSCSVVPENKIETAQDEFREHQANQQL